MRRCDEKHAVLLWVERWEGRKETRASCLAMPKTKALLDRFRLEIKAGMGLIHD
jgi:hypothetical protein